MQGIKWETVLTCSPHGYNNERRGEEDPKERGEISSSNDAHVANSLRVYRQSVPAEFIKGRAKTNGLQRVIVVRLWTRQYVLRFAQVCSNETRSVAWLGVGWSFASDDQSLVGTN